MKKGTNIRVIFKSAEGLKEGVTTLEYKGLQLGKVTKISMHEDLKSVKVNVKMSNNRKVLIFKFIEAIGKWSMIDIYVVALLASIVQLDEIFNIKGGIAATSFALMVILTMIAANRFDTRIIWDE